MPGVLVVAPSASSTSSRVRWLVGEVADRLAALGHDVAVLALRDLPAAELLAMDLTHPALAASVRHVEAADAVVLGSPVYKDSCCGLLKCWLDVLPRHALAGRTVLTVATGTTVRSAAAVDAALRPVLASMRAADRLPGLHAADRLVEPRAGGGFTLTGRARADLDRAVAGLTARLRTSEPAPRRLSAIA